MRYIELCSYHQMHVAWNVFEFIEPHNLFVRPRRYERRDARETMCTIFFTHIYIHIHAHIFTVLSDGWGLAWLTSNHVHRQPIQIHLYNFNRVVSIWCVYFHFFRAFDSLSLSHTHNHSQKSLEILRAKQICGLMLYEQLKKCGRKFKKKTKNKKQTVKCSSCWIKPHQCCLSVWANLLFVTNEIFGCISRQICQQIRQLEKCFSF